MAKDGTRRGGGTHSRKFQDLTGERFGRWVVLGVATRAKDAGGVTRWRCRCDCGTEKIIAIGAIKAGQSSSCGCVKREIEAARTPRPWLRKHHCSTYERSRHFREKYRLDGRTNRRAKERYHANLDASRAYAIVCAQRRRVSVVGAPGRGVTTGDWRSLLEQFGRRCAYCLTAEATTMDHVIPLSTGGAHDIDNIVPACRSCNSRKHAHSLLKFVSIGGGVA